MTWGAPAHAWAKLKAALGLGPKDDPPAVMTTTFEYPTLPALNLPNLPGTTVTTHTRAVLTESVECSVSPTPTHDVQILIVDNVVKAISSSCDRVSALTAAQLGGKSCGNAYKTIRLRLSTGAHPQRSWEREQAPFYDAMDGAVNAAEQRRKERARRRMIPTTERTLQTVWAAFIRQMTGFPAQVLVHGRSAAVHVETPGAATVYSFAGDVWALSQGPGDQRVYDLLNKHIKLNSKLVNWS